MARVPAMASRYDTSMVGLAADRYALNKPRAQFRTAMKVVAFLFFGGLAVVNLVQGGVTIVVVVLLAMAVLNLYLLAVDIRAARRLATR
jgi:hypothetical protein